MHGACVQLHRPPQKMRAPRILSTPIDRSICFFNIYAVCACVCVCVFDNVYFDSIGYT